MTLVNFMFWGGFSKIGLQVWNNIPCCEGFASPGLGPSEIEDKYFRLPLCQQGPNDVILQKLSHQLGLNFPWKSLSLWFWMLLQSLKFVELCWASKWNQTICCNSQDKALDVRHKVCEGQTVLPRAFGNGAVTPRSSCRLANIEFSVGMFGILVSIWFVVSVWRLNFKAFHSSLFGSMSSKTSRKSTAASLQPSAWRKTLEKRSGRTFWSTHRYWETHCTSWTRLQIILRIGSTGSWIYTLFWMWVGV